MAMLGVSELRRFLLLGPHGTWGCALTLDLIPLL
ncbi:hypothetical protein FUAX_08790 [Fulvitalea axinellae]|uniref:Uncharacterized protein n=1 Tax=Fulvitalea axinellae TaxID=1182444 RepID=A0AAU9CNE3_9BACT|nr:hypothetical protein FUAX_08790 [Fulvitalea axinellae]